MSSFKQNTNPVIQIAEFLDIGTLNGSPVRLEREFDGQHILYIGTAGHEISLKDYSHIVNLSDGPIDPGDLKILDTLHAEMKRLNLV